MTVSTVERIGNVTEEEGDLISGRDFVGQRGEGRTGRGSDLTSGRGSGQGGEGRTEGARERVVLGIVVRGRHPLWMRRGTDNALVNG